MKKRGLKYKSLFRILILVAGIITFFYLISNEIEIISAQNNLSNSDGDLTKEKEGKPPSSSGLPAYLDLFGKILAYGGGNTSDPNAFLANQGFLDGIISSASWAMSAYTAVSIVTSIFDVEEEQSKAISKAVLLGTGAGRATYILSKKGYLCFTECAKTNKFLKLFKTEAGFGTGVGISVALITYLTSATDRKEETRIFKCAPFEAETGGARCEECNNQEIPCSLYQCKSLGQACSIVNEGTKEQKCVWVNRGDVNFPEIKTWDDALTLDYKYTPDSAIAPPDIGVKIINTESQSECVKAFEPLSFGITTDEPASCKIDFLRKATFEEMEFDFGDTPALRYNHTQMLKLPGAEGVQTPVEAGEHELFVRCRDANGNYNKANFVFKFCMESGPDTSPPMIVSTNLLNNMPIAHDQTEIDIELYVSEPAECKWSKLDHSFTEMLNKMTCEVNSLEFNSQLLYKCSSKLTSILPDSKNDYYFRCKDKPLATEDRIENAESYKFTILGTIPLVMQETGPTGTIEASSEVIPVTLTAKTFAGAEEGKSICFYSDTGEEKDYIMFYNTMSHEHSQELFLPEGDYEYHIKCIDLGGNAATNITSFKLESDKDFPQIVRAYNSENQLIVGTDEKSTCYYDTTDCTFLIEDGTQMTTTNSIDHTTEWNTDIMYYVKCIDEFGNQPSPDQCSIRVNPLLIEG